MSTSRRYRATYRELWDTISYIARALLARGIEELGLESAAASKMA